MAWGCEKPPALLGILRCQDPRAYSRQQQGVLGEPQGLGLLCIMERGQGPQGCL